MSHNLDGLLDILQFPVGYGLAVLQLLYVLSGSLVLFRLPSLFCGLCRFLQNLFLLGNFFLCRFESKEWKVDFLEYKPQHSLRILPEDEEELTFKKWQKLINSELSERTDGELSDHFDYVMLKVKQEKLSSDDIKELEKLVNEKDAVLCKIQRIIPQLDLSTIQGSQHITSIEDIINRPPLDTLKEAFAIRHNAPMNERQEKMLSDLLTTSSL
jgi:DNA repair protein SbcD/Mre11